MAGVDRATATPAAADARRGLSIAGFRGISGYAWLIAAVTAVGFFFRFFLIDLPAIWRDEAFQAAAVRLPWLEMLDRIRYDSAPPLDFVLVKLANTVSSSPTSLRMVSVLAGTAMVPVAAAIGRRVAGNRAGVFAGIAMAVLPAYVAQARDGRMYALASLFVLAGALALWRAIERPSPGRLLAYATCVALGGYSTYFALPALGCTVLVAVAVFRPPWRVVLRISLAGAAGVLAMVPWLIFAIPQFQHAETPFWVSPIGISRIGDLWQEFVAGDTLRSQYPHSVEINKLRLLACGGAAVGGIGWIVLAWQSHGEARRRVIFPAAAGLVAVAVFILASLVRPLYDSRYAAVLEAPMVVAVGLGLAWLWPQRRPLGAALASVSLVAVAAHALALGPNPPNDDIRPLLTPLVGQVQGGDYVAIDGATQYYTVLYYSDAATRERTHIIAPLTRWFDGTALYRPDTWMTAVPQDVTGRVYMLAEDTRKPLPVPPGYTMRGQQCAATYCMTTWSR